MDAERQARIDRLLDRQDIVDCLTRFSRGMDRFDRELFLSVFHPDAVIAAGDFVGGPADLYDWAAAMHDQGQVSTYHNLLNHSCEIEGDTAHTETYYLFAARNRDRRGPLLRPARAARRGVADRREDQCHRMVGLGPDDAAALRGRTGYPRQRRTVAQQGRPSYLRPLVNRRQTSL